MMRRALCWLLAGLALAVSPAAAGPNRDPAYIDLTDDFARAFDEAKMAEPDRRAQKMRKALRRFRPAFYTAKRFGGSREDFEALLGQYLEEYPARRADIAAVSTRFAATVPEAFAAFEREIGPLGDRPPIVLLVSLGSFDGAVRTIKGRDHLLFGADAIHEYHGDMSPRALIHHELAHVYHNETYDFCRELWCLLWSEGMAVHIAERLNPGASDQELLLTVPEPIRPELETNRDVAVCAALARLDSTASRDKAAIFSFTRLGPGLPPRFGYLMGKWVVDDLAKTHTLAELISMNGAPLRAKIKATLQAMARCGKADGAKG